MNECEAIRQSIGSWLDGELGASEDESVRAHLAVCTDCGAARRRLEKMHTALREALVFRAEPISLAPFWREVERRIQEKPAWYDGWIGWMRAWLRSPRTAWAVPALIAVVLAAFSLDGWRSGSRNSFTAVDSIDAYGRSVALLRVPETKTTVIWLYQDQEGENETVEDPAQSAPSF